MVLSVAFLIRSVQTAQAAPTPQNFIESGTNKIGKYQISLAVNADALSKCAVIIDTETGQTTYYFFNDNGSDWKQSSHQLPSYKPGN